MKIFVLKPPNHFLSSRISLPQSHALVLYFTLMFIYVGTLIICEDGGRRHLPPWLLSVGSFPQWFMSHFSPGAQLRGGGGGSRLPSNSGDHFTSGRWKAIVTPSGWSPGMPPDPLQYAGQPPPPKELGWVEKLLDKSHLFGDFRSLWILS